VRLFIAVEIDPHVAAAAAVLTGNLRRRAERLAPKARITWIPEERLHVTVRFIGQVDDTTAEAVRPVLAPHLTMPPFDLVIAGAGAFPATGAPRVIWAGLAAGESLRVIEREVTERLKQAGVAAESRPYNPHVTLARVRDAAGLSSSRLLDGLADQVVGTTRVEAITLFESRLSPAGPTYVALQRTPLWKTSSS
jgi:2'-5' RNA ligase